MDLKCLRTFRTIIDEGGFSKAAKKLNYTQSTICLLYTSCLPQTALGRQQGCICRCDGLPGRQHLGLGRHTRTQAVKRLVIGGPGLYLILFQALQTVCLAPVAYHQLLGLLYQTRLCLVIFQLLDVPVLHIVVSLFPQVISLNLAAQIGGQAAGII